jgi:hypothetical protein
MGLYLLRSNKVYSLVGNNNHQGKMNHSTIMLVKNNTPNVPISVPVSTTNIKMVVIENARGIINLSNIEFYSNSQLTNKIYVCMGHFDNQTNQAFFEDGTSNCGDDGLAAVAASELKGFGGFSEYKFIDPDMNSFGHTDQDNRVMFWNTGGLKITGMRIKNRADGYHDRINSLRITFYTGFDGTQRIDQTKRLTIADRIMLVPAPDTNKAQAIVQFESNFPPFSAEGAEFLFKLVPTTFPSPPPFPSPSPSPSASATPSSSPSPSPSPAASSSAAATTPAASSSAAATSSAVASTSAAPKTTSAAATTTPASTTTAATTPPLLKALAGTVSVIPSTLAATMSPKPGDNTVIYAIVGVLGASVLIAGGAFMYLRSSKGKK